MGREIAKSLRETIGEIPTFILATILGIWTLYAYYRSWCEGDRFEFGDYVVIFTQLFVLAFLYYINFIDP